MCDVQLRLERIRAQAREECIRVTQHAHQEMVEEAITLDELLQALEEGTILEDYPEHRRGACCLIGGLTRAGRHLHAVCATTHAVLIVITVYEPKPPKWITPTQRGGERHEV